MNEVADLTKKEETPSTALLFRGGSPQSRTPVARSSVRFQGLRSAQFSKHEGCLEHPRVLLCDRDKLALSLLRNMQQAEVCFSKIPNLESLSSVVSIVSPDIVVLTKEALQVLLREERRHVEATEDLEYALLDIRPRDAAVIHMLAKGLRNHEIASSLGLSMRTVKSILSILYLRYDVTNRTELLGLLMEQGHSRATLAYQQQAVEPQATIALERPRASHSFERRRA